MSKLSQVYCDMFGQKLHPQALTDLEKWTHICMVSSFYLLICLFVCYFSTCTVIHFYSKNLQIHFISFFFRPPQVEKPSSSHRADRLIYPPLPSSVRKCSPTPLTTPTTSSDVTTPVSSELMESGQPSTRLSPLPVPKSRVVPKSPSAEPTLSSPQQPVSTSHSTPLSSASACSPPGGLRLPPGANLAVSASGGCKDAVTVLNHKGSVPLPGPNFAHPAAAKAPSSNSAPCHPSKPSTPSAVVVEEEMREKIKEILSKHSRGLWAPALPKLFTDTYKTTFPDHIMDNLSLLLDICRVEYPMPHDKKKVR